MDAQLRFATLLLFCEIIITSHSPFNLFYDFFSFVFFYDVFQLSSTGQVSLLFCYFSITHTWYMLAIREHTIPPLFSILQISCLGFTSNSASLSQVK